MDNQAPNIDKWLHADGSVTTLAGEEILPAGQNRVEDYASRVAAADKWLHPDGSVTDSKGVELLPADESRAMDYESRAAGVGGFVPGMGENLGGTGFAVKETWRPLLFPYAKGSEVVEMAFAFGDGAAHVFVPYIKESETVAVDNSMSDTASVALN
jgi:hypothetical protein